MAKLAHDAGIPAGIIQCLNGMGETGKLVSEHMRIRKISFTGSTRTGRHIMTAAAQSNLKAVTLELGGKSAVYSACCSTYSQTLRKVTYDHL